MNKTQFVGSSSTQNMSMLIMQRTTDSGANFWVGLARGGDGSFAWVDGTPFDLEYWLDGEPNSNVSDTLCDEIGFNGLLLSGRRWRGLC